MPTVYFTSLTDVDVADVEFVSPNGVAVPSRLLVDSGFTGRSGFVLGRDASGLAHGHLGQCEATGAVRGAQQRAVVVCRLPALSFESIMIALLADLSTLSLPSGVHGIAGLTFLRQFARWGAERTASGGWQFFLSTQRT